MKTLQELNSLALRTRRMLGEDSYSPIDIFSLVNGWKEKKITIVRYPLLDRISGMCTRIGDDIVIGINSKSSYGRQRFTLAHELYHILYEENMERVICDMSMGDSKSDSEKEADWFASYLLMPYDSLLAYDEKIEAWDVERVIEAEQFFQISHMAMIFTLRKEDKISLDQANRFQSCPVSRKAASLGFGKELYMPLPEERLYFTTGEYIRKVEQLAEKGLISNGKKEELLLDAFRADIVYNLDEEEGFNLND